MSRPAITSRPVLARAISARLSLGYFRSLRLAALRRLIPLAIPLWVQARVALLPAWVVWPIVVVVGLVFAEAAIYALLEHRWSGLAETFRPPSDALHVRLAWTPWAEVRSGLLYAMAVVTSIPWLTTAAWRIPEGVLSLATGSWTILLLALAVAELLRAAPSLLRARGTEDGHARG